MALTSGSRINTNLTALNSLTALNNINRELGVRQARLATGRRVNSAADDPSGYVISKKMEGRIRSMTAALDNVGDAVNVIEVAEGGYQQIAEILVQIKEKQTRFTNGAMGDDEKTSIADEIAQLATEIGDIIDSTKFNGTKLIDAAYDKEFQVGEDAAETLTLTFGSTVTSTALLGSAANLITSGAVAGLTVDDALKTVNSAIGGLGSLQNRLQIKEANLTTAITNTEGAKSRIWDADIAKEQLKAVRAQVLQQTSIAQLSQANAAPQVFLQLFR